MLELVVQISLVLIDQHNWKVVCNGCFKYKRVTMLKYGEQGFK
jgi:hypothetical protein